MHRAHSLRRFSNRPGNSLMEVLIALGVLVLFVTAFGRLIMTGSEGSYDTGQLTRATYLAEEGLEGVRHIALSDFDALADGTYGIGIVGGVFAFSGTSTMHSDGYERTVVVETAGRNATGGLLANGGTPDESMKRITSEVQWEGLRGRQRSVALLSYVAQWRAFGWLIDLLADFSEGFRNSSDYVANDNGEVRSTTLATLTSLSGAALVNGQGNTDIIALAIDPRTDLLYAGGRENTGTDNQLLVYDISDVSNGNMTLVHSLDVSGDVVDIAIGKEYAFLATTNTSRELQVLRLSDHTIHQFFDINTSFFSGSPTSISYDTNRNEVVLTTEVLGFAPFFVIPEVYVFDVSSVSTTAPVLVDEVDILATVTDSSIAGDYLYISTEITTSELVIADMDTISSIQSCDLVGTQAGRAVFATGSRLFIGRDGGGASEFAEYAINPADPDSCTYILANVTGEVNISSDDVSSVFVHEDLDAALLTTFNTSADIVAVDLTTFTSTPTNLSAGDFCESITGVGAFVYVGCRDNTNTLFALQGSGSVSSGFTEDIYTDGEQNGWNIGASGGNSNEENGTILVRTGSESLEINPAAGGATTFSKSLSVTNNGSVRLFLNSVSPWAFGIYGDNGGNPHSTTQVTNASYGSAFETNSDEDDFTDFPVPDYNTLRSLAQASSSYINAGNSNLTLDTGDLAAYTGDILFVEFTNGSRRLRLDFDNSSSAFNFSVVMFGGDRIEMRDYNTGMTWTTSSPSVPLIVSSNDVEFDRNRSMTANGLIFAEDRFESNAYGGSNRLTINGSIVAGRIDNRTERVILNYTTNFNTSPPSHFSPSYSGQSVGLRANGGTPFDLDTAMGGAIDSDPTTWQEAVVSFVDLGLGAGTLSSLGLVNLSSSNEPTYFVDDMSLVVSSASGESYTPFATYTSPPFDSESASTTWSEISWTANGGTVGFRMRTASSEAALEDAYWVGPDGTVLTSYSDAEGEEIQTYAGASGTRWIQWKAYLSGDGSQLPVLEDVSVSYE